MKLLFLDIDGVLNGHDWDEAAQSNRIQYRCVKQLNRIIAATGCKIVLSSAWRYMILKGAMTKTGFEYLLRTHGAVGVRIVDTTCLDEQIESRVDQIRDFLVEWPRFRGEPIEGYCILDDEDHGFCGRLVEHFVKTDGMVGLTEEDANDVIAILNRE